MNADDDSLLTLKEVAEKLAISNRTLARIVSDGSLPTITIRRRRLVSRKSLRDWLAGHERKAA